MGKERAVCESFVTRLGPLGIAVQTLAIGLLGIACTSRAPGGSDNGLGVLTLAPSMVAVPKGRTVPVTVSLDRRLTSSPITVTANGLPAGVYAEPVLMTGSSATLPLSASASAQPADDIAVMVVASSGNNRSSAPLSVSVTEPGFSLSVAPPFISIGQGSSRVVSVTVSRRDFPDPISVTVSDMPPGVTADPLQISANRGNLRLRVAPTVPLEAFDLILSGFSSGVSADAPLTLRVVEPTPLDDTFGASGPIPGLVVTQLDSSDGGTSSTATAAAIQADEKIVVVGTRTRPTPPPCGSTSCYGVAIVRYNPNGTLDPTFIGDAGVPDPPPPGAVVVLETTLTSRITANGVAISDAGVLIALSGPADTLLRLTAEGALDADFNPDGGRPGRAARTISPRAVGVSTDEKILVAGQTVSGPAAFALARYNADGSLDQSFGASGILARPFVGATSPNANGAVFTPDGKVKVVGTASVSGRSEVAIMAFDASGSGSVDESFNGNGQVLFPLASSAQGKAVLAVQDNSVVVARTLDAANRSDVALAAFQPDGGLDQRFGDAGISFAGFPPDSGVPNAGAASDEKIAAVGTFNTSRVLVLRDNLDGSPDPTFGPGGTGVVIDVPAISGPKEVNGVVFQADGKIVLVGSVQPGTRGQFAVVRYAR